MRNKQFITARLGREVTARHLEHLHAPGTMWVTDKFKTGGDEWLSYKSSDFKSANIFTLKIWYTSALVNKHEYMNHVAFYYLQYGYLVILSEFWQWIFFKFKQKDSITNKKSWATKMYEKSNIVLWTERI